MILVDLVETGRAKIREWWRRHSVNCMCDYPYPKVVGGREWHEYGCETNKDA